MTLDAWISTARISNAKFADAIGVSRQAVSRYRLGERIPRPKVIKKIEAATKGRVTANDFVAVAA